MTTRREANAAIDETTTRLPATVDRAARDPETLLDRFDKYLATDFDPSYWIGFGALLAMLIACGGVQCRMEIRSAPSDSVNAADDHQVDPNPDPETGDGASQPAGTMANPAAAAPGGVAVLGAARDGNSPARERDSIRRAIEAEEKAKAKERQKDHGKTAPGKKSLPQKSAEVKPKESRTAAAKRVGLGSHDTASKVANRFPRILGDLLTATEEWHGSANIGGSDQDETRNRLCRILHTFFRVGR